MPTTLKQASTTTTRPPAGGRWARCPGCAELARYRRATPVGRIAGLTIRQAAEIDRILTRYGHTTWRDRPDETVLVTVYGQQPLASDPRLLLVMRSDGTIVRASGRARRIARRAGAS